MNVWTMRKHASDGVHITNNRIQSFKEWPLPSPLRIVFQNGKAELWCSCSSWCKDTVQYGGRKCSTMLNIPTILQCRQKLGWTFRGSSSCQLIRHANKVKRFEWTRQYLNECKDGCTDVFGQMSHLCKLKPTNGSYCKKCCAPKSKPR